MGGGAVPSGSGAKGGDATVTVGTVSTLTPSAVEASAVVPRAATVCGESDGVGGGGGVVGRVRRAALSTALAGLFFEHIEALGADGQAVRVKHMLELVVVGRAFVLEHEHEAHATRGARVALLAIDHVLLVVAIDSEAPWHCAWQRPRTERVPAPRTDNGNRSTPSTQGSRHLVASLLFGAEPIAIQKQGLGRRARPAPWLVAVVEVGTAIVAVIRTEAQH
eukprot:scaffold23974_cov53-Phaeocystis_antarctica.AAC.2